MGSILSAVRRPLCAGVLVSVVALGAAGVASADRIVGASAASETMVDRGDRGNAVRSIQRALGIPADGIFGPQTERAVRRFQRRRGLTADGVVGPMTRRALGLAPFRGSSVRKSGGRRGGVSRILEAIAQCESGGNPRAVSPGGLYRGKYQFSRDTWQGLGARGDPADAPEWLQDRMARKLYRQSGNAPWPNCP